MKHINRNYFISITLIVIVGISIIFLSSRGDDKLRWTSINVCNTIQGDAHIITKNGKYFLIDTGSWKEAKKYLLPYLKEKNIKNIEAILITHPHFDHYGGITTILENNITVNTLYMNMPTQEQMQKEWWGGEYKHLLTIKEIAKKYNTKVSTISRGDLLKFDEHSYIDVLYAYDGVNTPVGMTDINDMSVITMLHDDENKFLLTGDLNRKLGTYLANNANDIEADILKAPHHGAESFAPNSFFTKVNPKAILVPAPQGLWCSERSKRLRKLSEKHHYDTYISGFHGHITVTSYDNNYIISTEKTPTEICKEAK